MIYLGKFIRKLSQSKHRTDTFLQYATYYTKLKKGFYIILMYNAKVINIDFHEIDGIFISKVVFKGLSINGGSIYLLALIG